MFTPHAVWVGYGAFNKIIIIIFITEDVRLSADPLTAPISAAQNIDFENLLYIIILSD